MVSRVGRSCFLPSSRASSSNLSITLKQFNQSFGIDRRILGADRVQVNPDTPGDGRIRALVTSAGNPVLSTPNGRQLDRALAGLEFMVSVDPYLNETTRHAHLILPPTSPLERPHYDIALASFAVRNVAKYSAPLFPKPAGALHDDEILAELTVRLGSPRGTARLAARARAALPNLLGPERTLDLMLRTGTYGAEYRGWLKGLTALPGFGGLRKLLSAPDRRPAGLSVAKLLAEKNGIGMFHQHFMLVPTQTVTENILLGLDKPRFVMRISAFEREIGALGERYGLHVDPGAKIWQISVGEQQRVEILKVLYRGARVLILDEPTAVLAPQEIDELFRTLRAMVAERKSVVFISHKLNEVSRIADRVTVLRKGRVTAAGISPAETSASELARLMVGREVIFHLERKPRPPGEVVLSVEGVHSLNDRGLPALRGVTLNVRAGEIVGLAGVVGKRAIGAGRSDHGSAPADAGSGRGQWRDVRASLPARRAARPDSIAPKKWQLLFIALYISDS